MKKRKYQWKNRLKTEPFSTVSENITKTGNL